MCLASPNQVVQATLETTCRHAEVINYFEWVQQHGTGKPDWDRRLADDGETVPVFLSAMSGSCRWGCNKFCFLCWWEMVTQLDDEIIRDGLTDMQFVRKGQRVAG